MKTRNRSRLMSRWWVVTWVLVLNRPGLLWGADELCTGYAFKSETSVPRETHYVPRTGKAPVIDGVLEDEVWRTAFTTDQFVGDDGKPTSHKTRLFVTYDAEKLYVAAICETHDKVQTVARIAAGQRDANGTWNDDCIDFKLSADDGQNVQQFILAASGAFMDNLNQKVEWNPEWERGVKIGESGYVVEVAIRLQDAGMRSFDPGTPVLISFNRVSHRNGDPKQRMLIALSPPYGSVESAPLFVLGSQDEYGRRRASVTFTRDADIRLVVDRDQYPGFQEIGTGRVIVSSNPQGDRLKARAALRLALIGNGQEIRSQRFPLTDARVLDFDFTLRGLPPGDFTFRANYLDGDEVLKSADRQFAVVKQERPAASGRIRLTVPPAPADLPAWPYTFGIPFPWGVLDSPDQVKLFSADGTELPIQTRVTCRWSKMGSLRWILIDTVLAASTRPQELTLVYGKDAASAAPVDRPVETRETAESIVVNNGDLRLVFPRAGTPGLAEVSLDQDRDGRFDENERLFSPGLAKRCGPYMADDAGTIYWGSLDRKADVVVEESGPVKTCVRVSGAHISQAGEPLGRFILRYYVYRGCPFVRLFHTFGITEDTTKVRYGDIAYALPAPGFAKQFYGTPQVHMLSPRGLETSSYLVQYDHKTCKIFWNGAFVDEQEQAEGWVSLNTRSGRTTLTVKDFWQNYPKELEATRDGDRLIVHFWPAHGRDPVHVGPNLSARTLYPLWFAHEGKFLDFTAPKEFLDLARTQDTAYTANCEASSAMGLAKTHEMLIHFHAQSWETARARSVSRVFQSNPTITCDPAWVCSSGVLGKIRPRDEARFAEVEQMLDSFVERVLRQQRDDADYGMFNFGDSHHHFSCSQRAWALHRIWHNTHHGWTRWPWLCYARTGRKDVFDWADENARHVADIDHCHYTTKQFESLPWPRGKVVGGICDYKGIVHWSSGSRVDYNSAADAMLDHYYFTGDRRSLDAAIEHGRFIVRSNFVDDSRTGSARITSLIALYFLTWDNDYIDLADRNIRHVLDLQDKETGMMRGWATFAPFLERYIDLTQSREAMRATQRWADALTRGSGYTGLHVVAHAYLYSGDVKYLRNGAYRVADFLENRYLGEDDRYFGMYLRVPDAMANSYILQEAPYYLAAAARYGQPIEPLDPAADSPAGPAEPEDAEAAPRDIGGPRLSLQPGETVRIGEKTYSVLTVRLHEKKDAAFRFQVDARLSRGPEAWAELKPVGDKPGIRVTGTAQGDTYVAALAFDIPEDATLDYELRVYSEQNFSVAVPITSDIENLLEVYRVGQGGVRMPKCVRLYFDFPDGAERATFAFHTRYHPMRVEVVNPQGRIRASDMWVGANDDLDRGDRRELTVPLKDGTRGWTMSAKGSHETTDFFLDAVTVEPAPDAQTPVYFGIDPTKVFLPEP